MFNASGQEPHHQIQFRVISRTLVMGDVCKGAVDIIYSPSLQGRVDSELKNKAMEKERKKERKNIMKVL